MDYNDELIRVIYRLSNRSIATIVKVDDGVTVYSEYTHDVLEGPAQEVIGAATAMGMDVAQIQEFLNTSRQSTKPDRRAKKQEKIKH
jgi:hypothetical protein